MELLEGIAKVLVLFVVHREESGVDHGFRLAIARHGGVAGPLGKRDGVANAHGLGILQTRDDEADLTHAELADEGLSGTLDTHAISQEALSALHHEEVVALGDMTVEHAHGGNNATILVKVGVENQRLKRSVVVSLGRRDKEDNRLEKVMDALTRLARYANGIIGRNGELLLDLLLDLLRMGAREVDLVDRGNDIEVGVHGEAGVGDRLCLDALGGVNDENGALARSEGTRDLIGEVHVTRGVDEVELVGLAIIRIIHHANGVALDRDAALALDIHRVEKLRLHVALLNRASELEDAIRDGGLAMVDVSDDGEVPDVGCVCSSHVDDDTAYTRKAAGRELAQRISHKRSPAGQHADGASTNQ